jgi:membrane protein
MFGATGVFAELRDALNTIWDLPRDDSWTDMLHDRLFAFLLVLGVGFLLLASLIVSAGLSAAGKFFGNFLPTPKIVLHAANFVFSFLVITGLFAMIYKILPDAPITWGDVWIGAAAASFLFATGKLLIGLYLGKSGLASS